MFSKKLSLYIPRIYPESILKHLKLYAEVFEYPDWTQIIQYDIQEGIQAYISFLVEYLGYGSAIRVALTKVNNFYQADVYINWVESSDSREFQYEVLGGNYRVYHPDQTYWIVSQNTKKMELEPMEWIIDTEPDADFEPLPYDDYEDPSWDYDKLFW